MFDDIRVSIGASKALDVGGSYQRNTKAEINMNETVQMGPKSEVGASNGTEMTEAETVKLARTMIACSIPFSLH
jgi:hypothetical protein